MRARQAPGPKVVLLVQRMSHAWRFETLVNTRMQARGVAWVTWLLWPGKHSNGRGKRAYVEALSFAAYAWRVEAHPRSPEEDTLYQDVRWPRIGRFQYGVIAYPLLTAALVGSLSTGVPWHVALALGLFGPPIGLCEWRLRTMGILITPDCVVLVRPLNRTPIPWSEIDAFTPVSPPGWVDHGTRRVGVKRRRNGIVPRTTMTIPTVWMSLKPNRRWPPPFGPAGLKWSGGEITDVMGFLNEQLAARRNGDTPEATLANSFASPASHPTRSRL
jgi:hypothetical protein